MMRSKPTDVHIFRPLNAMFDRRYLVVKFGRDKLRVVHVATLGQAQTVRSEWGASYYELAPGNERPLHCADSPHPPMVCYSGPEHLRRKEVA